MTEFTPTHREALDKIVEHLSEFEHEKTISVFVDGGRGVFGHSAANVVRLAALELDERQWKVDDAQQVLESVRAERDRALRTINAAVHLEIDPTGRKVVASWPTYGDDDGVEPGSPRAGVFAARHELDQLLTDHNRMADQRDEARHDLEVAQQVAASAQAEAARLRAKFADVTRAHHALSRALADVRTQRDDRIRELSRTRIMLAEQRNLRVEAEGTLRRLGTELDQLRAEGERLEAIGTELVGTLEATELPEPTHRVLFTIGEDTEGPVDVGVDDQLVVIATIDALDDTVENSTSLSVREALELARALRSAAEIVVGELAAELKGDAS